MRSNYSRSLLTLLVALLPPFIHAQKVTNPKAAFLNVNARRALLQSTTDPRIRGTASRLRSCVAMPPVAPPQGEILIPHHYLEDSHGATNPAEAEATLAYRTFQTRITAGMNRWVATGDEAEARCALDQMAQWAQAKALLNYDRRDSPQAWYQAEWTLSSAGITASVLAQDDSLNSAEFRAVDQWLDKAAHKDLSFEKPSEAQNNHHYWRGLAATSIGIAAGDDKLFRFGIDTYKDAIGQIDKNGSFPLEMARHERALHYQLFALDALIMIATYAQHQGIDLYSYSRHGRTLRDAVMFFSRAVADPSLVKAYASEDQIEDLEGSELTGIEIYASTHGAAGLSPVLLHQLAQPTGFSNMGGNATVLFAQPVTR